MMTPAIIDWARLSFLASLPLSTPSIGIILTVIGTSSSWSQHRSNAHPGMRNERTAAILPNAIVDLLHSSPGPVTRAIWDLWPRSA